ncbi:pilus assembly protein [Sphingomonas rhizophila]|uniref:Pilus assembly protein n=1 Tax=Sphingomonas rhizophila TaxID=2071607 RepID=A0A7G9S8C5_9SPHN|nr:TadE/TadG family type IV pilus assembly protein [Sphingomonas rhizophila]QNN64100.1 pilus assembly protein [Sphingomonas rhizophila]
MMKKLIRNQEGAAAIEMAFALPILILFIYGIFQVGIAFQASAGMQNALGEGARLATLFPEPTNDEIVARINAKVFGTKVGQFGTPTVTNQCDSTGDNACPTGTVSKYKDLSVNFKMTPDFLFFKGPEINLTRTKRVYTAGRIT